MSIRRFRAPSGGRKAAMAAGLLGIVGALTLGAVSPASASSPAEEVTLIIFQRGGYVAALCGMDNLEGRCTFEVPKGGSATFTVRPGAGEPVAARVVPNRGGFDEVRAVPDGGQVCFETAGTQAQPTIAPVACD